MADPVRDLVSLAQATPDPGKISNWLVAYLGTRPRDAKLSALKKLETDFEKVSWGGKEERVIGMILRVIKKLTDSL
jgi:hypothetical protein